ncbi:hypothetical protein [Dysgonomonas sp. 25]|uniref:hypothetical protein n=1 Tax=Dysgonomonas sp. 25 TaxID=2302933 RepID=UPI0013CFFEF6|nr:hypothetical protein [Dysgonomonas sp. 25]
MRRAHKIAIALVAVINISIFTIRAQEPITITGRYTRNIEQLSKRMASELFIQEQAAVALPGYTQRSVYTLQLDDESAQRAGRDVVGVVFVNNVAVVEPALYSEEPLTLTVYPLKNGIFYCKDYLPQDATGIKAKQMYDNMENDIAGFLEHAIAGDTLKQPKNSVDSRYTKQLIKNLSNDNEVYIEQIMHGDGVRYKRFLGIVIKKKNVGYSSVYYESIRMSDFARNRLKEIFRPIYWNFNIPDTNASAEEWQAWLDTLLKT